MQIVRLSLIVIVVTFMGCNRDPVKTPFQLPSALNLAGVTYEQFGETITVSHDAGGAITDDFLQNLKEVPHLRGLLINSYRQLESGRLGPPDNSITDSGLAVLSKTPRLERLRLRCPHVTNTGVKQIVLLKRLQFLDLSGTRIDDDAVELIAQELPNLTELALNDTSITDECVVSLAKFQHLEFLDLVRTLISSNAVAQIREAIPECHIIHIHRSELSPAK